MLRLTTVAASRLIYRFAVYIAYGISIGPLVLSPLARLIYRFAVYIAYGIFIGPLVLSPLARLIYRFAVFRSPTAFS